jgi:hypothetical protein
MPELKWEEVLARREDFLGGEALIDEDGVLYRGPISDLRKFSDFVEISFEWCATCVDGKWVVSPTVRKFVNTRLSPPQDIGYERIRYEKPMLVGYGIISPPGSTRALSREDVVGFEASVA